MRMFLMLGAATGAPCRTSSRTAGPRSRCRRFRPDRTPEPASSTCCRGRRASARATCRGRAVEQHTREPGAKSRDELISTSYRAAPGTASHENCGSTTSGSETRSAKRGAHRRRPDPHERPDLGGRSLVALGIDRRDAPVVRAGSKGSRAGEARRLRSRRPLLRRAIRATGRSRSRPGTSPLRGRATSRA